MCRCAWNMNAENIKYHDVVYTLDYGLVRTGLTGWFTLVYKHCLHQHLRLTEIIFISKSSRDFIVFFTRASFLFNLKFTKRKSWKEGAALLDMGS